MISIIDYSPLWNTMARKGVTQYRLLKDGAVDNKTLDSLKKDKNITVLTLERLCAYLDCTPNDVIRFTERKTDAAPSPPPAETDGL